MGNCIYIDAEGRWWIAKAEILGKGEIILIKEWTDKARKNFSEYFLNVIDSQKPHILFFDENDDLTGISAKERKVVHKS